MIPGLVLLVALAIAATAIASTASFLSALVVGVVLGAITVNVLAATSGVPAAIGPGVTFGAKKLLRVGIVVLGLRLSLGDLGDLGASGLAVVALVVAVTFFGTQWLARRLGVPEDLGLLVATGYSICGASAIAAMDGVVRADEEETAYAITLVTLCGTLSIFVLPLIGHGIGLDPVQFGTWVGGAVHDVGQVVATASVDGSEAVEAATVVKLTRVALLAPLVAAVAISFRQRRSAGEGDDAGDTKQPPLVPLFVLGFLAMVVVRSTGWLSDDVLGIARDIEKWLITIALVGLGMGVRLDKMRRLGGRPLVLGLAAWILVAGTALAATAVVA